MEVKNGIIIDGVLHEAVNYSNDSSCSICSLRKISEDMKYNYGRCYLKLGNLIGCFPTYTLQDIIQKLPPSINICMLHIYPAADLWYFVYMDSYTRTILSTKYSPDIMNAAYQMLCWVIENGHLETNK